MNELELKLLWKLAASNSIISIVCYLTSHLISHSTQLIERFVYLYMAYTGKTIIHNINHMHLFGLLTLLQTSKKNHWIPNNEKETDFECRDILELSRWKLKRWNVVFSHFYSFFLYRRNSTERSKICIVLKLKWFITSIHKFRQD